MAPSDKIHLPLRWQFPWTAHSQTGALAMQSERSFETLTECMDDAREPGYGG